MFKAKSNCIKDSVYIDEGFSGKTLERPQFRLMMEAAKQGEIQAVVVYRLDRISRNIGDFAGLIEKLGTLKISFVSIREQFDTESPMGRAMMYIASVFSQLERETIAERVRDNMLELSKTGRWLGGTVPTGYISEQYTEPGEDGRERKLFRLKKLPEEAEQVRIIFSKFLETGSLAETEKWLCENGYCSKNGRQYSRHTLKGILQNPVYAAADDETLHYFRQKGAEVFGAEDKFDGSSGLIAYNRTVQKDGKAHEIRRIQEWILAVGGHEGIVDGKTWVETQETLERNRTGKRKGTGEHSALFSGILFCGGCACPMRKKMIRGQVCGKRKFVYLCTEKEKSRGSRCRMKNAKGYVLDEWALETLGTILEDSAVFAEQMEKCRKRFLKAVKREQAQKGCLRRLYEAKEGEIERFTELLGTAQNTSAEEYILQKIERIHEERLDLKRQMEAEASKLTGAELSREEFESAARSIRSFTEMLKNAARTAQSRAVRNLVERAVWDGDTLHLYLKCRAKDGSR